MAVQQADYVPGYDRIAVHAEVLSGKACIRGTRIGVDLIVHLLASGWSVQDVTEAYPELQPEDVARALHYAADLASERNYPLRDSS